MFFNGLCGLSKDSGIHQIDAMESKQVNLNSVGAGHKIS